MVRSSGNQPKCRVVQHRQELVHYSHRGLCLTMSRLFARKIVTIGSRYHHDLTWSLQPICWWMHMIGIPSGPFYSMSMSRRWPVHLIGLAMMLWGEASMVNYLKTSVAGAVEQTRPSFTVIWTDTLQNYQMFFTCTVIMLNLFLAGHCHSESLWKNVEDIEESMALGDAFYRSLRRTSYWAVVVIFLVKDSMLVANSKRSN